MVKMKLRPIIFAVMLSLFIIISGCSDSKPTTTTTPTKSQPTTQAQPDQKTQPQQQTETKAATPTQTTTPTQATTQTQTTTQTQKATAPVATSTKSTQTENKSVTVYVTKTGEKYHSDGCSSLSKSKIPMSLSDARASGYTPCSKCNPPQ
jgi:cytoskeletal protein RodZ